MNKPTKQLAIAEATGAIRAHLAHLEGKVCPTEAQLANGTYSDRMDRWVAKVEDAMQEETGMLLSFIEIEQMIEEFIEA